MKKIVEDQERAINDNKTRLLIQIMFITIFLFEIFINSLFNQHHTAGETTSKPSAITPEELERIARNQFTDTNCKFSVQFFSIDYFNKFLKFRKRLDA